MALIVNTNTNALRVVGDVSATQRRIAAALGKVSSGQRIHRAADDAAGLAVAETLDMKKRSASAAQRNIETGMNAIHIYEGVANEVADILKRQKEIAVQASSDTLTTEERHLAHQAFYELQQEYDRIAKATDLNDLGLTKTNAKVVIDGAPALRYGTKVNVQVGLNDTANDRIELDFQSFNMLTDAGNLDVFVYGAGWSQYNRFELGITTTSDNTVVDHDKLDVLEDPVASAKHGQNRLGVATAAQAQASLDVLDFQIDYVNQARARVGAQHRRLEHALNHLTNNATHGANAESRIRDADFAFQTARLSKLQLIQQAGTAVLGQANSLAEGALRLI